MDIEDKIKGTIYGHAIGDAIGLGTEFLNKTQVEYFYPEGYSGYDQMIQDKHRSRWKKGEWTDDTDQMLCILESLIEKKKIDITDIAKKFHSWAYYGGRGIGNNFYNVLIEPEFLTAPHSAAKFIWVKSGKVSAPNGAVMRTSVLGIWRFNEIEKVKINTENVAKITHYDPRCVGSSFAITYVISELLKGELKPKKIIKSLPEKISTYDSRIEEYIKLGQKKNIKHLSLDERNSIGYTLKAMACGIWVLKHEDFRKTILEIVNEGGDADTNAAVAGAVLGAKLGYNNLPQDWINGLLHKDKLDNFIDKLIKMMKETRQI